jgi:hypothetical protein
METLLFLTLAAYYQDQSIAVYRTYFLGGNLTVAMIGSLHNKDQGQKFSSTPLKRPNGNPSFPESTFNCARAVNKPWHRRPV